MVWVSLGVIALGLLVLGARLVIRPAPPQIEVVWEKLGPGEAAGRVRNLTGNTLVGMQIHFWGYPGAGFGSMTREEEYAVFPAWVGQSPWNRLLPPGAEEPFTVPLDHIGSVEFPVAMAPSTGDTREGDAATRYVFRQTYQGRLADGY